MSSNKADSNSAENSLEASLAMLPELIRKRKRLHDIEEREKELKRAKETIEQDYPNLGQDNDVLRLNVGGSRIDVLRRTLTSVEGSMLAAKFSSRWDDSLEKDADGNFFIDQPMELFKILINYLREKQISAPSMPPVRSPYRFSDGFEKRSFYRMVEYYGLTHGIYPVNAAVIGGDEGAVSIKAKGPDFLVEAGDWACIKLYPASEVHSRTIESFAVVLGQFSSANVGWLAADSANVGWLEEEIIDGLHELVVPEESEESFAVVLGQFPSANVGLLEEDITEGLPETSRGVGEVTYSVGIDCAHGRIIVDGDATDLPGVTFEKGATIRCEKGGENWYVNDRCVATTQENPTSTGTKIVAAPSPAYRSSFIPAISLKGDAKLTCISLKW